MCFSMLLHLCGYSLAEVDRQFLNTRARGRVDALDELRLLLRERSHRRLEPRARSMLIERDLYQLISHLRPTPRGTNAQDFVKISR